MEGICQKKAYQTNEEEEHEERSSQDGSAIYVSISHRGHGYDEKVHTCPVRDAMRILKV